MSGSGISWAVCKSAPRSRQITTIVPHHSVFTGQMPILPPNQQRQSTEGTNSSDNMVRMKGKQQEHTQLSLHTQLNTYIRLNTYGRRVFSVAGLMAWNSLPDFVRDPMLTVLPMASVKANCSEVFSRRSLYHRSA